MHFTDARRRRAGPGPRQGRGRRGFTLLELMVIVGLIGVIFGLAAPSLRGLYQRMGVGSAMRELYAAFIEAQGLARGSGRTHELRIDRAGRLWEIRADRDGDDACETRVRGTSLDVDYPYVDFGPEAGYGDEFPSPYAGIDGDTYCSFCDAGGGAIFFDAEGAVVDGTSGSILMHDRTRATPRIDALVFVGATGDVRLFTRN